MSGGARDVGDEESLLGLPPVADGSGPDDGGPPSALLAPTSALGESDPPAGGWRQRWGDEFHRLLDNSIQDYRRLYSPRELLALGGGIGLAAAFANTLVDQSFQDWHDAHVATHDMRKFAYVVREFGNGKYFLPFYAVCLGAGEAWPSNPTLHVVGEWGDRSLRSFLVGGPALLVLQRVLGASRPEEHRGSNWVSFRDAHSASGHAFIGGISFINAAMMTDSVPLKSAFYVASIVPGWSRIIQDKHYVSQVVLGWWLGYLSASAVNWTEQSKSDWLVTPVVSDEGMQIAFLRAW
jgi:membrane-associated phospholipid phosphatase